jgi:hypothetical protein
MPSDVMVWDLETVPDIAGFARANNLVGKSPAEIRAAMGDEFPKLIYHSIICIGALVATRTSNGWEVQKAGFGDVKPHVDVKTFNKWMLDDGLRPVGGSKSIRVAHLRLFHRSQCRPVTAEEKAATQQQSDAAVARHMGKVIPINAEANPQ